MSATCPAYRSSKSEDIRWLITETKSYGHQPEPLRLYIYRLGLSQTAERLFWEHWYAGQIRGNWKSVIPVSVMAKRLCVDRRTLQRAYDALIQHHLVRRYQRRADPRNPHKSLTAITEVIIPDAALSDLLGAPDRKRPKSINDDPADFYSSPFFPAAEENSRPPRTNTPSPIDSPAIKDAKHSPVEADTSASLNKITSKIKSLEKDAVRIYQSLLSDPTLSAAERFEVHQVLVARTAKRLLFEKSSQRKTDLRQSAFDLSKALLNSDKALASLRASRPKEVCHSEQAQGDQGVSCDSRPAETDRVQPAARMKLLQRLGQLVSHRVIAPEAIRTLYREAMFAITEGAFSSHQMTHALNIVLKLIRERRWQTPQGMPQNWCVQ